ncbi:hypothetical protein [Nocardia huaxiensis]|uniref:Secreted protein n=1 Tax=Nocardia huaxiensis TaxID=2755382 RepID=A0A7D6VDT3_9NOCA|nr:hypothetical protein [Nocardia huaxiensis]QLY27856.1 hypothetical protein H0264_20645 [Nocardia huaxiensis]UFS98748.1 hypothetical protein LPY97_13055 [Nocardia huaxiensis]
MNTTTRTATRVAAVAAAAGAAAILATGTAAADEWPVQQPNSPITVGEVHFLTPDDPNFWNPFDMRSRLTSPYGNSTRVVCTSFHGRTMECFQADADGNPHKLSALPINFPNFTGSGNIAGGTHYVYPGFIPGLS